MYESLIHKNLIKAGFSCHSVENGIYSLDMFDRIIYWNVVMEQLTGISASICLGRKVYELFPFLKEIGEDKFIAEVWEGRSLTIANRPYLTLETGKAGKFDASYHPVNMDDRKIVGATVVIYGLGIHMLGALPA